MLSKEEDADEPEWILENAREQRRQYVLRQKADIETRLARIREREKRQRERFENGEPMRKKLVKRPSVFRRLKWQGLIR